MIEIGKVTSVKGHKYRSIFEIFNGFEDYLGEEVQTPNCGWQPIHICTEACNPECKCAQELFDAIGIKY